MKETWEDHIFARPSMYQVVKKNSAGEDTVLRHINVSDVPEKYRGNIDIRKESGRYYWVSNGNQELTKTVVRTPALANGKPTGIFNEKYIYKGSRGTITIETTQYELLGCKGRTGLFWAGNIIVTQPMENEDFLKSFAYYDIYKNPFQHFFCDLYVVRRYWADGMINQAISGFFMRLRIGSMA